MAVGSRIRLAAYPREDAEPGEQALHPANEALADHVQPDQRRAIPAGHVAIGLEQAAQIGRDNGQRSVIQPGRHSHRLDGQRGVRTGVPTNKTVRLQPARERRLGDLP